MALRLDRAQVVAHRAWAQGLHGTTSVADLGTLTVGLQDTPAGSAVLGLRHRTPDTSDDAGLVLALTVRGAPHLHRRGDLPLLRAALAPRDNEELRPYLGGFGDTLVASNADGPALLARVAAELRATFPGGTPTKGDLSNAVSPGLPEVVRPWCEGCGTAHVADGLFRLATLYAGLELVPGGDRMLRFRLPEHPPEQDKDTTAARTTLLHVATSLAGPLNTRSVTAPQAWLQPAWAALAADLTEVEVAGQKLHATTETINAVTEAPAPPAALLLPPRDAYLLGHRPFLAPDRTLAKEIWRAVGSPGALATDGELAGTWRARKAGRKLRLTVTPHLRLSTQHRKAVFEQAEIVAASRAHEGPLEVTID